MKEYNFETPDFIKWATFGTAFIIEQNTIGLIERFGKYHRIARPGMNFKIPFIETVKYQSLRVRQLNVDVESKTADNVFVTVQVSVQYKVDDDDRMIYKSVYELEDPEEQITSYIFDVVRAEVPKLKIDEIFNEKTKIAKAIKDEIGEAIREFGYVIIKTLITDIKVDNRIINAMNDIVASEREKQAIEQRAEAEKIKKIKAAEAEAEAKKLQGQGIANQRKEIIKGFTESIKEFKDINGVNEEEVLNFVLLTQYFDTLKEVANSESNTIMLPGTPGGFKNIADEIREAIISGNIASKNNKNGDNNN